MLGTDSRSVRGDAPGVMQGAKVRLDSEYFHDESYWSKRARIKLVIADVQVVRGR